MTEIAGAVVSWFWEQYRNDLADKALGEVKKQWGRVKWKEIEARYRSRLREQHRFTRLPGNPKPIKIEDIFTDVYILDQPTAVRRYSLDKLEESLKQKRSFSFYGETRRPLLRLAVSEKRLFLLGKPGSGKTTFLRYLTLQACAGKIKETPIFIELRDWASSGLELLPYLVRQFEICAFPDALAFITHLLEHGNCLVMFDGLDEVNQEGQQRANMIRVLKDFARQYQEAHICLTCRIAATDYSFEQFTYLEIADFTEPQVHQFATKWYQDEREKGERFLKELDKPDHKGLKELTHTPILLALLCLAFDQTLEIPANRTELYKEAFDVLLKRWDASRNIRRDTIYKKLTSGRRENMLASIAAENFEKGKYFIPSKLLTEQIVAYIKKLPGGEASEEFDGEDVLREIEAQHGILVERAHLIYSFSHLTFQEYLTARYIVENAGNGSLEHLTFNHLIDDHWREVFLMTASLLNDASEFFDLFFRAIANIFISNPYWQAFQPWAYQTAIQKTTLTTFRNESILVIIALAFNQSITHTRELKHACTLTRNIVLALSFAQSLDHEFDNKGLVGNSKPEPDITLDKGLSIAIIQKEQFDQELAVNKAIIIPGDRDRAHNLALDRAIEKVRTLHNILISILDKIYGIAFTSEDVIHLNIDNFLPFKEYLDANQLLLDCLKLAVVQERKSIYARILIPLEEQPTSNYPKVKGVSYV